MSIQNPTEFTTLSIGGVDRSPYALRVELWRTMNSVGVWKAALRNTGGVFNNTFDIQDQFFFNINVPAATIMQGRVDGPGVTLTASDVESIWDEYIVLSGYDEGQDLLFHNDFEYLYPDPTQTLDDVLDDVFNTQLAILPIPTNITYAGFGGTPAIGPIEFRMGSGFLSTIQEAFQRADYLFYVDDNGAFQLGAPGFSNSGVTVTCESENPDNNIIGTVEFQRRDGGKLYNKISVYGKTPQFDAYTEYTAARWATVSGGWTITDELVTIAPIIGNTASVRMDWVNPPAINIGVITLDFSAMGQDEVDMSSGEIGFWFRYDGGTSGARACAEIALQDASANTVYFYSGDSIPGGGVASTVNSTRTYQGVWGWCRAPVGYDVETGAAAVPDTWFGPYPAAGFDWNRVTDIGIRYKDASAATAPDEFEIDGLRLPFPALGFAEDAGVGSSQALYRPRPLVVNLPYIRHQLTLESKASQLLSHHKDTGIDLIKFTTEGTRALRYAGQTVTVNIPSLGLNDALFYMSSIHHIIEPYSDVSSGYGFDWITEVEAIPIDSLVYDMGRLRDGPVHSAIQLGTGSGVGQSVK